MNIQSPYLLFALRRVTGSIRGRGLLRTALLLGLCVGARAVDIKYDLTAPGPTTVTVAGAFGGNAIFADQWSQPTGTGVFDPFLSLDANGKTSTNNKTIESAFNSDAKGPQFPNLYLDQHRPEWNTYLRMGELATIGIGGANYFGFILDANEPGGDKSLISVDNIRIYTSTADQTSSVANDLSNLDNLGTLRWALNNPLSGSVQGFNVNNWVKLDAAQEGVSHTNNGGSGQGDMIVYVPQAAFGSSVGTNDFVWLYNLNGVHKAVDKDLASQAGYEEWRAVERVPDNGSTVALLGIALTALAVIVRLRRSGVSSG